MADGYSITSCQLFFYKSRKLDTLHRILCKQRDKNTGTADDDHNNDKDDVRKHTVFMDASLIAMLHLLQNGVPVLFW